VKIVSLDVHGETSQLCLMSEEGEVLLEMAVATQREELRRIIGSIPGPKQVVFEEGPLSAMLTDALQDLAEEVVSCDPTKNALISEAEDSNDERDARRLATLARLGTLHQVYNAPEPFRTMRSLLLHDRRLEKWSTSNKNRIKALCHRHGLVNKGKGVFSPKKQSATAAQMANSYLGWQMGSLYRQLQVAVAERRATHQMLTQLCRDEQARLKRFDTVPGVGVQTARTVLAWIIDPRRFRDRNAISAYGGLGLRQSVTHWEQVGRSKASRRGQRELKRSLFIAARAAENGENALARRAQARRQAGWDDRKIRRDVARTILQILCGMWDSHEEYKDELVPIPK
jgi:transposase